MPMVEESPPMPMVPVQPPLVVSLQGEVVLTAEDPSLPVLAVMAVSQDTSPDPP